MKKLLLFMMMLITSIASWAEDPYFEVISGSFASGNVTVKVTFPDASSVTPGTGAWIYLDYETNGNFLCYANGGNLNFPGDNTFTATFSFTCPENAQDELFMVSPYNNDISVDDVSQPRSLAIRLRNCSHESLTLHAATNSTESTHGNVAYNECNQCGKVFRISDTEHTTPLRLEDVELPLLCAAPHYEVISGSFATGDAKVRVTFPKATEVTLSNEFQLYYIKYGTGEAFYNDPDVAYQGSNKATAEGNSVTVDFSGRTFNNPVDAAEGLYYIYLYENTVNIDGVANAGMAINRPTETPKAEVLSGSLTEGSLQVKITIPLATAITDANLYYYGLSVSKSIMLKSGDDVLDYQTDNNNVTLVDNTITTTFQFTPLESDDLSNCSVDLDYGCVKFDGSYINEKTVYFNVVSPASCVHENLTRHEEVESTDMIQGHSAYDQCGDCGVCFATTDTEHVNPMTAADFTLPLDTEPINYFYVENLESGDCNVAWSVDANLEYSYDKINWSLSTGYDNLPAYGRIYYRATTTGNTFLGKEHWQGVGIYRQNYAVGGDITTLLRSNGKVAKLPEPTEIIGEEGEPILVGVFENFLFGDGLSYLKDISNLVLPSTTLSERCYKGMLANNALITNNVGPTIEAVTMAPHSCDEMFFGTKGIESIPDLKVETMAEYSCYEMFAQCTNLITAPELPATTVAPHCCELMFSGCENLTKAPSILPATTLADSCYTDMFSWCTELERAPELPAPSLVEGCYVEMFEHCPKLNYIKVGLMTDWPVRITYNEELGHDEYDYYCTRNWVAGVNGNGTFCGPTCPFKEIYPGSSIYDAVPYYHDGYSFTRWNSETALTVPVTISSVGFSTFCYDYNWIIPQGTEGYIAYVNENGEFHFEKGYNPGDIVQSYRSAYDTYEDGNLITQWVCKAVVLKGAPGTYEVSLTDIDAPILDLENDPNQQNALYGSMHDFDISLFRTLQDINTGIMNDDYYYYALSLDAHGENVGFYWMKDNGAPFITKPYKAFLRVLKNRISSSTKRNALVFGDDETVTGIYDVPAAKREQKGIDAIYDLTGRRVMNANAKGLYIINGKKVAK